MLMTIYVWCVDITMHRVQKFSIERKYVVRFGNKGTGNGQLDCPLGIMVHNNRVYVAA